MKLHYTVRGSGPDLIILHGVFGMSDNWRSVALALSDRYRIWTPDLRNHGRSPHSSFMGLEEMASDVIEMMETNGIEPAVILGHSMGGKLAMHIAMNHRQYCKAFVVVDIGPGKTPFRDHATLHLLRTFKPEQYKNRKEIEEAMRRHGLPAHVTGLMLKNIGRIEGRYQWKPNINVILDAMPSIGAPLDGAVFEGPALFLFGADSNNLDQHSEMLINMYFPNAGIETIRGAGHWVHADQPKALIKSVDQFLSSLSV